MAKIFLNDLFETLDPQKIFMRILFQVISVLSFCILLEVLYKFWRLQIFWENSKFFLYVICLFSSFLTTSNPQRIVQDVAIKKGERYKICFLFCSFLLSTSSSIFLGFVIFDTSLENIALFFFLFFSTVLAISLGSSIFLKIFIFIFDAIPIFLQINFPARCCNFAFLILFFLKMMLFFFLKKQCFYQSSQSEIKSDIIGNYYEKNERLTPMLIEWLFLFREKKHYIMVAILVSFASLGFFVFLKNVNEELFYAHNDFKVLLFASLNTGAFTSIIGPYMVNWFYFYADDLISKNFPVKKVLQAKIDFLRFATLCLFVASIPFIFLIKIDFFMMIYFFFMNSSVSVFLALLIGIMEVSRVDGSASPRFKTEKGSVVASYIPWVCEVVAIVLYILMCKFLSDFWIMSISVCIFVFVTLLNKKVMERLEILMYRKIEKKSVSNGR